MGETVRMPNNPGGVSMRTAELVVLLDEQGNEVGTAPKATVHTDNTPLHRAFSCYLFDARGRLLLTRRADTKATFPGVWTNSVCGHPAPGESDPAAIVRRAGHELQLTVASITVALPDFRYRASSGGVVENEICPVYLARTDGEPHPEPSEVEDHEWCRWPDFVTRLGAAPQLFSPWCQGQTAQLEAADAVGRYLLGPGRP